MEYQMYINDSIRFTNIPKVLKRLQEENENFNLISLSHAPQTDVVSGSTNFVSLIIIYTV